MKEKTPVPFVVLSFLIALFVLPIVAQIAALHPRFNFVNDATGKIASTINNFTAPLIGLLSAFLLYRALMAQVQSNRIQRQEHNAQIVESAISDLERKIHDIEFGDASKSYFQEKKGLKAVVDKINLFNIRLTEDFNAEISDDELYWPIFNILGDTARVRSFIDSVELSGPSRSYFEQRFFSFAEGINLSCFELISVRESEMNKGVYGNSGDSYVFINQAKLVVDSFRTSGWKLFN
jgi:hypothetical protein